jgi:leucyl aminopeptidase
MRTISTTLKLSNRISPHGNIIYISIENVLPRQLVLSEDEEKFVNQQKNVLKNELVMLNRYSHWMYLIFPKSSKSEYLLLENLRKLAAKVGDHTNHNGLTSLQITDEGTNTACILAVAEGILLNNYQFIQYRSDADTKTNSLTEISVVSDKLDQNDITHLSVISQATLWARDLVNEPVNKLNAIELAENISETIRSAGGKAEVLNLQKIESLKMGGLLAVNKGSIDPPTFTILEWKPDNAMNSKPIILVGKGVVYDSGGYSLKPGSSMETMKCDMAGGATVSAIVYAVALLKLPIHLIALVPATDNRLVGNAYVPGDIITMMDGTTVEVLNTDAEGRLILADALSYAKKFNPMLVLNFATLTGSAGRAIGSQGIVAMQSDARDFYDSLAESGHTVHERLVEFPMWDEYNEQIKSKIADLKNIGGTEAGAITAGKFLEHFTNYPFIHFDIASPAFLEKADSYRGLGGTGIGVRLVFDFLKKFASV